MSEPDVPQFIFRATTPDRPGTMAQLASFLASKGCDIRDAAFYGDPASERFFIRMRAASHEYSYAELARLLEPFLEEFVTDWSLDDMSRKQRVLVAVSKFDHCLVDLLYKARIGALPIEIVGVVSNHPHLQRVVEHEGLAYHYLPITSATKLAQESKFRSVIESANAELVVLARYMQILSDGFTEYLSGRCINIHHSFLPSFKGSRPYHQAHSRGVKLIGATAHYVTGDLDEGPIIEQDVRRVTHEATAEDMVVTGRDVEASVLSRAVRWHSEHRVFLNGDRTVIL